MRMSRASIVAQCLALAFVVLLVVRFSASSSTDAVVFDQARDLQQAVSQAVATTNDVVRGIAQPQSAANAIDRASSASQQLSVTRTGVESAQLRSLATQMVATADQILAQLSRGSVDRAEELRANRLVPLASEVAQLKRNVTETAGVTGSFRGASLGIGIGLVLLVVGGIASFVIRQQTRTGKPTSDTKPARTHDGDDQRSSPEWIEPGMLYTDTGAGDVGSDSSDDARATRMRPIDVELRALLESTIEQAGGREWSVELVCPEVHISGDPIRISRTILAMLGTAYLEGARRVGIIVDDTDDNVQLSIGHDAPIDDATAEHIADRLESQLANALGKAELGWSVTADEEIILTTVPLGVSLSVALPEEVSA